MANHRQHVTTAVGFLELGMAQDAWDELEMLPPEFNARDSVLDLRIEIFQLLEKWESARVLAESLAKRSPGNPHWWLLWAYSLRRERSVAAARQVLLEAASNHPDVPLIPYNLACYACVLGELEAARKLLKTACSMNGHLRQKAINDPDLRPIVGEGLCEDSPPEFPGSAELGSE